MEKLYVVLRSDLTPGQMLPQTGHGVRAFTHHHPKLDAEWHENSKNLVVLEVPDEKALIDLHKKANDNGVPACCFQEPDLGNSVTCIALGIGAKRLVSSLPLALRGLKRDNTPPQSLGGIPYHGKPQSLTSAGNGGTFLKRLIILASTCFRRSSPTRPQL